MQMSKLANRIKNRKKVNKYHEGGDYLLESVMHCTMVTRIN